MAEPVDQKVLWNGAAGRGWVEVQDLLDRAFAPMQEAVVEAVADLAPARVLDVGCGTGGLTVALAQRLGAACTGVDVSEPMVAAAIERAASTGVEASFLVADAQRHPFEPGSFDVVTSRFGVMFFDDPTAAFTNLRAAAVEGRALCCLVWRGPEDNPFFTLAAETATALDLLELPPYVPGTGGQFGFADPDHVRTVLGAAGWSDIALDPVDLACTMPEPDLDPFLARLGALGRALADADEETTAAVVAAVRPAFASHVEDDEVRFTAACWLVSASA